MTTTAQKLLAACNTINAEAIKAVAAKNGITVAEVLEAISYGNTKAIAQLKQFVEAGMRKAVEMHEAGEINLI